MADFFEALKQSTKTEPQFSEERQHRLRRAQARAQEFHQRLLNNASQLAQFGVEVKLNDRTISFKRGSLEVLAVTFGTEDGTKYRIFSPVAEYFKLTPSYQDLNAENEIDEPAGRWLGHSIELVEKNREVLAAVGLL